MNRQRGFTLVELVVAMGASTVMLLAVVGVLANNQREFNQTYTRVHGEIVRDAYIARRVFEEVVRKSSTRKCLVGSTNDSVEVYYHSSGAASELDRYAQFYFQDGNLMLERGEIDYTTLAHVSGSTSTQTIAHNVTNLYFGRTGPCVRMHIFLDNGSQDLLVTVTATRHNE